MNEALLQNPGKKLKEIAQIVFNLIITLLVILGLAVFCVAVRIIKEILAFQQGWVFIALAII